MSRINQLVLQVASALVERDFRLITAESCTGGLLASCLTSVAGSSAWFEGSYVTYRLSAKRRMLGVPATVLDRYGAVSEPTARAMAEGALTASDAQISAAITGIAGPEGGDVVTPVGTVWFAWALRLEPESAPACVQTCQHNFSGSRADVREHAAATALDGVLACLG